MYFGKKIKDARIEKNLTQTELAEKVGVTRQTIGLIESGDFNPTLKLCIDISLSLDKTLNEIFWDGNIINKLSTFQYILITDIGSTTTKSLLLEKKDNSFIFLESIDVPTTVEKPFEDVKIGIINAALKLQNITNVKILSANNKFKIPYITTSSAGGGLQIIVFGVSSVDTGKTAEMTVNSAGGIILKSFTVDDRIPVVHKMRMINKLHPDLILMAGGIDNGNISSVLRNAEILSMSNPSLKYKDNEKIPVIYCGNIVVQPYISQILSKKFNIYFVDNIRPTLRDINIIPAKRKIHDLFMTNVMEQAPGYSDIKKAVRANILPTPSAVEKILSLYSSKYNKNIVMFDIGGATCDIFSIIKNKFSKTVAANIGMSYSINQILSKTGYKNIKKHLSKKYSENIIRNYISNKMLYPTYIPTNESEFFLEHSIASEGISIAWEQHKEMNFKSSRIGFFDRIKKVRNTDPFLETFYIDDKEDTFQLSDIDIIIGSGGIISHTKNNHQALKIIVDSFKPIGITKVAIDKYFKSPHLGILSTLDNQTAIDLFIKYCYKEIAYVIVPTGSFSKGKTVLTIEDINRDISFSLKAGEVFYYNNGGNISISTNKKIIIYSNMTNFKLNTELPILIDCRGRGDKFSGKPLSKFNIPEFNEHDKVFKTEIYKEKQIKITKEKNIIHRSLPYEGEIFIKKNSKVDEDTIIGENTFSPPKIYIVDLKKLVGYDKNITEKDIEQGILVKVGDRIKSFQKIFKSNLGLLGKEFYRSPVRGEVIKIEKNGILILREIQDYSSKPVTVNLSKLLNIKPKHLKNRLKFKVGDFIEKGQTLINISKDKFVYKSPTTGILKNINTNIGTICIDYNIKPIQLKSFVKGKVVNIIDKLAADIEINGTILYGVIGFGNETTGMIKLIKKEINKSFENKIAISFSRITKETLEKCVKFKLSGIVAPSIHSYDWVDFIGKEIGIGITGDEDIPFTFILTEGFGNIKMKNQYIDFFNENNDITVSLSGRTQIRAGVIRPMIIVS